MTSVHPAASTSPQTSAQPAASTPSSLTKPSIAAELGLQAARSRVTVDLSAGGESLWDDVFQHSNQQGSFTDLLGNTTSHVAGLMSNAAFFSAISLITVLTPGDAILNHDDLPGDWRHHTAPNDYSVPIHYTMSRLQLTCGLLAITSHMCALVIGLQFDAVLRSCPTKQHLCYVFKHHHKHYHLILQTFKVGLISNLLQTTFIVAIQYGYIEGTIFGIFLVVLAATLNRSQAAYQIIRKELLELELTAT